MVVTWKNAALARKPGKARLSPLTLFFSMLLLFPLPGCRTPRQPLEAELRKQEKEARELREENQYLESINDGLMREMQAIRQQPGTSSSKVTPERASQLYTLKEITLGRLTGGYDEDNRPGDEALQVIVEPRDPDGHAIKAPGSLQVTALEIRPEGVKVPLSTWDVPPEKLRKLWRSGLMSTGYQVILPWQHWPSVNKLRVTVRMTLPDGRVFEADKDLTIRLPKRRPVFEQSGPELTPEGEIPLPRSVEPPGADNRGSRAPSVQLEVMPAALDSAPTGSRPATLLAPVAPR